MPEPKTISYELDVDLRIVSVDAAWSTFAEANDAPELVPPGPLGQSALSCISDSTTKLFYDRLFHQVLRTGRAMSFPIRCDAPALRRYLELRIEPRAQSGLRIETTLTRAEPRPPVAMLARRPPPDARLVRMCGWCKLVDVEGYWCEVEEALTATRLFEYHPPPAVTHVMCPACRERIDRLSDDSTKG